MHRRAILTAALALAAACAAPGAGPAPAAAPTAEVTALLQRSADEWNRGSLEGFLLPYLDSPDITFVGARGLLRGKDALREMYRSRYFATGAPAGTLTFRDIEVRALGPDHALAVGRWSVTDRAAGSEAAGLFSLTLVLTPDGWRIVHDHSS